jgi:predicted ester cyclase
MRSRELSTNSCWGCTVSEANKALVRRFYEALNTGDIGALDAFVAPDFVDHNPLPGQAPGLKGIKDAMAVFLGGFPDMRTTNEDMLAEGNKVVVRSVGRCTNTGPILGIPPTGKPVEFGAIDIFVVKDGKLVEAWHVEELLQMMMQMGVVPAPGG